MIRQGQTRQSRSRHCDECYGCEKCNAAGEAKFHSSGSGQSTEAEMAQIDSKWGGFKSATTVTLHPDAEKED